MVADVVGWSELMQGNLFGASFNLFNVALSGWSIFLLFCVFQSILYIKTRNVVLMWVSGFFFVAMFATSAFIGNVLNADSIGYMFALLILELAGILYLIFFKE